jgi:anti-sigma-K factor RskA
MSIIYNNRNNGSNDKFYRTVAGAVVATVLTSIMAVALAIDARPRSLPDLNLVASQSPSQVSDLVEG